MVEFYLILHGIKLLGHQYYKEIFDAGRSISGFRRTTGLPLTVWADYVQPGCSGGPSHDAPKGNEQEQDGSIVQSEQIYDKTDISSLTDLTEDAEESDYIDKVSSFLKTLRHVGFRYVEFRGNMIYGSSRSSCGPLDPPMDDMPRGSSTDVTTYESGGDMSDACTLDEIPGSALDQTSHISSTASAPHDSEGRSSDNMPPFEDTGS